MQRQLHRSAVQRLATGLTFLQHQPEDLVTSICFGFHVSTADTLTLLIKASATVTVYRKHCRTLLPAQVNSLFITCIGIIRNIFWKVDTPGLRRTPATERTHALMHMAADCLATRPQGQVNHLCDFLPNF